MDTKRRARRLAALLVMPLLFGCSTLQTSSAVVPGASFAGYHTYAHGAPEAAPRGFARTAFSPAVWQKVQADVDADLASKGYVVAPPGTAPDFIVRSGSGARVEERREDEPVREGNDPGDPGSTGAFAEPSATDYVEAALVIDVFDGRTRKLVWRGASDRKLQAPLTSVSDTSLAQAVTAILRALPKAATDTGRR
jgi:hypothetical protein